ADVRLAMYGHIQRLSMGFYGRTRAGDILACFSSDLAAVENVIVLSLPMGASSLASVLLSTLILFLLEWRMALAATLGLALCLFGSRLLAPAAQRAGDELKDRQADLMANVQESVLAQPLVKAFGLHHRMMLRFQGHVTAAGEVSQRANFLAYLLERIPHIGVLVFNLLVVVLGAWLAFRGWLAIGTLVAFQGLLINLSGSLWGITLVIPHFVQAIAGMRRIDALLAERPEIVDVPDARPLARLGREIAFRDVSFSYGADQGGLRQVSFTIPAGTHAVFVGGSGSGKSTVLSLLLRLYDPSSGTVAFDGVDLRTADQGSLRAQCGVVMQESFLFNASARENLRLVKPDATDEEIDAACRAADIHDTLAALPRGYDTPLGERGSRLSGGQRQRVAIARALLRDPALLVLDEATSALDPASEEAVGATLARVGRGRTVGSVTHRLAGAVGADRIFVMEAGRRVEWGTHAELLRRRGRYFELWEKQNGVSLTSGGDWAEIDAEWLGRLPVFEGLDPPLLEVLAKAFVTEQFAAERFVIQEGDEGDRFYVVARGRVEVLRNDAAAQPVRVAVLEDGDHFGEMALLSNAPRNATVRTLAPTTLIALPRGQFANLVGGSPGVRARLEATVRRRAEASWEAATAHRG
ncbi:MAG: ATP-binding cassette domain-containing protein, partial [Gemmatimonadetes bacterium]|nr:ATP-binding cassette domain-containing protein [Gemmatimonadota bacterium]